MINFKFLKSQLKSSVWVIVGISLVLILLSIATMSFTPYFNDNHVGKTSYTGAISLLGEVKFFGIVGEIIAVTLAIKLISVEIAKGYMGSWLTLPLTRTSYFLTKVFAVFLGSLIVIFSNIIVKFMIAGLVYRDFNWFAAWTLIKLHIGLLLTFFFISAFATIFNRTSYAVTFGIVVPVVFIILFFASTLSEMQGLEFLKYFRYLTFFSLFDFNQIIDVSNLGFIWKFIVLFVLSVAFYIVTTLFFRKKDLFI